MIEMIILALVQAATEFLPVSSSGHLALVSGFISEPDLFFFTALHIASLLAVLVFCRREILGLLSFDREHKKLWGYLIIATIPAALFGYFFKTFIESFFYNLFYIGVGFIFTGIILLLTKFYFSKSPLNWKNSLFIGLMQALALFPGISRSGMTISAGIISSIERDRAVRFSFLLFIPLALGAFLFEFEEFYFSWSLAAAFIICFVFSLLFLNLLKIIVRKGCFWMFSFYCFILGIICLLL